MHYKTVKLSFVSGLNALASTEKDKIFHQYHKKKDNLKTNINKEGSNSLSN